MRECCVCGEDDETKLAKCGECGRVLCPRCLVNHKPTDPMCSCSVDEKREDDA